MDALARRDSYDLLLDEVHALELDPADAEGVVAAVGEALPKLLEAAKHVEAGEDVLVAELHYHIANLVLILGQATKQPEQLARARSHAERGLQAIEGRDARILEAMLRYVRAGALTLQGQLSPAVEDLSRVVATLEPHVAEMRRVRAEGTMAEKFAVDFVDRRVQAEKLLDEARAGLRELGGIVGAIRSTASEVEAELDTSEAVRAAERTNARARDPRPRVIEAVVITVAGALAFWYFDSLLARVVIAAIVLLTVTSTISFLRRLRPAA